MPKRSRLAIRKPVKFVRFSNGSNTGPFDNWTKIEFENRPRSGIRMFPVHIKSDIQPYLTIGANVIKLTCQILGIYYVFMLWQKKHLCFKTV
jgi:hypothetical protein